METRNRGLVDKRILRGWFVVLVLAALLPLLPPIEIAELKLLDQGFAFSRRIGGPAASEQLTIVGIDDATLQAFPEPIALWHRYLGAILSGVASVKPIAIGLDIELPERSYDFVRAGSDRELLRGLVAARAAGLVIARGVDQAGRVKPIYAPFIAAAGDDSVVLASWPLDRDLRVRRFDERLGESGAKLPTFAGTIVRHLGVEPAPGLLDFGRGGRFEYVPAQTVYQWIERGEAERLAGAFSGRIVLIGSVLPFTDRHMLPVALAAWEDDLRAPGILIHAQALRTLLGPGTISSAPVLTTPLLIGVASLAWFAFGRLRIGSLVLAAFALVTLIGWMALLRSGLHVPIVAPLITASLASTGRIGFEAWFQRRERARLKRSFEGYVSPNVLHRILQGDLDTDIGSGRRMLCVLFADIRNFTPLSEHAVPEHVVTMLNLYFERMTAAIHAHDGTVDNFRGDGIMCFFGAPLATQNPCRDGFLAARGMIAQLEDLNRELGEHDIAPIAIGVSLAYGEAIVGRIGAGARHEYTAIGDVANVSARIEGLTKEVGYPLVVSETVARALAMPMEFDDLGLRELKGHAPVRIYGWPARRSGAAAAINERKRATHA